MFLIGSSLVRSISLWGFNTYRGAFFVYRFGISTQEVGWIFTMAGMGLLLGGAVASSRFSRLPLYWLAIVGTAAIGLGGGLALVLPLGILPAIALTILTSFGLGFSLVATDTLIVNRAVGQRATATSLNRVSTNIGVAVGSSGGGLMIAVDGYPLLGTTVLGFGAAALILLWLSRSSGRASSEPAS
jgi:predicted MFS family arabinose efflux permease